MSKRPLARKVVIYNITGARHVMYVNCESNIDAAAYAMKTNTLLNRFPNQYHISYIL